MKKKGCRVALTEFSFGRQGLSTPYATGEEREVGKMNEAGW